MESQALAAVLSYKTVANAKTANPKIKAGKSTSLAIYDYLAPSKFCMAFIKTGSTSGATLDAVGPVS